MSANNDSLQRYYRLHARLYDVTRWTFLFGRERTVKFIGNSGEPQRILEVGCGTGRNLESIYQLYPHAGVTGIDLSAAMIDKAMKKLKLYVGRVRLLQKAYDFPLQDPGKPFDVVLCSYALSMFNPGWEQALDTAFTDLAPGGRIVVVDFHDSRFAWFKQWMSVNHVSMGGHLRSRLLQLFEMEVDQLHSAYGGLWQYHLFVGRKTA